MTRRPLPPARADERARLYEEGHSCLFYTFDAAYEVSRVDLGGLRHM